MQSTRNAEDILDGLNTAQRVAVASPASALQILAPPGSGKTKTLTTRVAYLLRSNGYEPQNIIVATFTVRAAREMRDRLGKMLGDGSEKRLILGTFHSVSRRFLVRFGKLIDIRPGFGIVDTSDALAIINRIIKRNEHTIDARDAMNKISSYKAKCEQGPITLPNVPSEKTAMFQQVFTEYESALETSNMLDYDDLLRRCVELLQRYPHCVRHIEAVLIDEYQDTNIVQFQLMNLLASAKKRVTIVGDPDQSIYGFRHAEIRNLDRMRAHYHDATVVNLEQNYRSSGAILECALKVVEQDSSRPEKPLVPTHCAGCKPVLRSHKVADDEASWIVHEIKRSMAMTANVLAPNDYAILLRSAFLSRNIELALAKSGISYRMVGGNRFFDRVEVKIIIDYLRVISQPDGNDALARIINVPPRRIGEVTIKGLLDEAERRKVSLWSLVQAHAESDEAEVKISRAAGDNLVQFVEVIQSAKQKLAETADSATPIADLVDYLLEEIDFEAYLKGAYRKDHEGRWANVQELISQTREFAGVREYLGDDDGGGLGNAMEDELAKFLANLALSSEITTGKANDGQGVQQVTISTMHASKGLEWPVVFIPAAYDGSIPHSRAEDHDEERRLLYVAMTRAQALLYISYPEKAGWQPDRVGLSPFLRNSSVRRILSPKDLTFDVDDVRSICVILGRDHPSQTQVPQAWTGGKVATSALPPMQAHARPPTPGQPKIKHPRYASLGLNEMPRKTASGSVIPPFMTMQNPSSFSVASTTMNPGFVSAGTRFQNVLGPGSHPAGPPRPARPNSFGSAYRNPAQGQRAIAPAQAHRRPMLHQISNNRIPGPEPTSLSRTPRPLKRAYEPSKPYDFLSSSPSKAVEAQNDAENKVTDPAPKPEVKPSPRPMRSNPARKPRTLGIRRDPSYGWKPPAQGTPSTSRLAMGKKAALAAAAAAAQRKEAQIEAKKAAATAAAAGATRATRSAVKHETDMATRPADVKQEPDVIKAESS